MVPMMNRKCLFAHTLGFLRLFLIFSLPWLRGAAVVPAAGFLPVSGYYRPKRPGNHDNPYFAGVFPHYR
jgi:hypothetical protein